MGSTGALGRGSSSCGTLDGKYRVGSASWVDGVPAPGIAIKSASRKKIVFTVAAGTTLKGLCVKTGSKRNKYDTDATLPVSGPRTVKISRSARRFRLSPDQLRHRDDSAAHRRARRRPPDVTFSEPIFIDRTAPAASPSASSRRTARSTSRRTPGRRTSTRTRTRCPGVRDFLWGYTNQTLNWRSTDGGKTWAYSGPGRGRARARTASSRPASRTPTTRWTRRATSTTSRSTWPTTPSTRAPTTASRGRSPIPIAAPATGRG